MLHMNLEKTMYGDGTKLYEQQDIHFHTCISEYASRLFDNKICVVDNSEFVRPDFNARLEEYLYTDEDFRNACLSYETQIISDGIPELHIYKQKDDQHRTNEVLIRSATNLSDFIREIVNIEPLPKHKCVYRGHGNWIYDMIPGIYRNGNERILANESKFIKDIVASNPRFFVNCKTALDILAVLQHFGFPTRLLDFTENPIIALYMACASDSSSHADIIRVDINEDSFKFYDSDTISILSNIALFDDDINVSDFDYSNYHSLFDFYEGYSYHKYGDCINNAERQKLINEFNNRNDIKRLVHKICEEKPYFKNEIDPMHLENTILLVKPKQEFERLSLQSGLFALFGIDKCKPHKVDFEFQNLEFRITHIIVPSSFKQTILRELEKINIHQGTVYGDMDNIIKHHLKQYKFD